MEAQITAKAQANLGDAGTYALRFIGEETRPFVEIDALLESLYARYPDAVYEEESDAKRAELRLVWANENDRTRENCYGDRTVGSISIY